MTYAVVRLLGLAAQSKEGCSFKLSAGNNHTTHRIIQAARLLASTALRKENISDALSAFIDATSNEELEGFSHWERYLRYELPIVGRSRSQLSSSIVSNQNHRFVVPWLDLTNSNGFRRERALRVAVGGAPNPFLFILFIRRLNDWVPQVRTAAAEMLPYVAQQTSPAVIAEALFSCLPNCANWGRIEQAQLEILHDQLDRDGVGAYIAERLISSVSGPAAAVLSQVSRRPCLDATLFEIAAGAVQPSVRAKAYQFLLVGQASWFEQYKWVWTCKPYGEGKYEPVIGSRALQIRMPFLNVLAAAVKDRSVFVRRAACSALIEKRQDLGADTAEFVKLLASDPWPSVSDRARYVLDHI